MSLETFASPGLRWGLLLEDHPGATHSYELRKGSELGIPDAYGGSGQFCVCTINVPGLEPIVAYKPAPPTKDGPDGWVVACTKTLGRALKKAGYPDDMTDLKALVLWRQRNAEREAIAQGLALEAAPPKPLEITAGSTPPQEVEVDPGEAPDEVVVAEATNDDPDDDVVDAEVVPEPVDEVVVETPPLSDAERERILADVASIEDQYRPDFEAWLKRTQRPSDPALWAREDLLAIDRWFEGAE